MAAPSSIDFFDAQFQRQVREHDFALNPFETAALPFLSGDVLDYGCGLGNLSIAAAERGCRVTAIDASATAVARLREEAVRRTLCIEAEQGDLRRHELRRDFDAIACIGLLMFFDCPTAFAQLAQLERHVRPGGVLALNVLVEGTTYLDMFEAARYCLFKPEEVDRHFASWSILSRERRDFPAPESTTKAFLTVIARKPGTQIAAA